MKLEDREEPPREARSRRSGQSGVPMKPADQERQPSLVERLLGLEAIPIQWEVAAYIILVVLSAALRFWDLGSRALHHDESLHATYSWYLATGKGYRHDPMMHGPFQFHFTAAVYFLMGVSDYTSRVLPALFGTALVGLPWLLRRQLGRSGALASAGILAISPVFLYYSRFARNDIYMAVWTLLTLVFIWRYLEERRRRDLYFLAAVLALSFTQKETAFINVAIFGSFLFFLFVAEPLARLRPLDIPSGLSTGAGQLLVVGGTLLLPLFTGGIKLAERLPFVAGKLPAPTEPAGLMLYGVVLIVALAACALVGTHWDRNLWPRLAILFWAIYVVLYTTFLSNMPGFGTGVVGSLTYWLDQQGVKRGDQPAYYYLLLMSIYEFLPVIFGTIAIIYYLIKRSVFTTLLIYWAGTALGLYSFAGEKMPWLSLHVALPLVLLSGRFIGNFLARIPWKRMGSSFYFSIILPVVLLFFMGALLLTWSSRGIAGIDARRELSSAVVVLLLFVALLAWLWSSLGRRWALRSLAVAGLAVLLLLTVRTSLRASFQNGDVPVEMAVYTQSSPDIPLIYREIEQVSIWKTEGKDLSILVDGASGFAWPWAWYLRDYKNAGYPNLDTPGAPPTADVVIVHSSNVEKMRPLLTAYNEGKRYHHRWWFPEIYRDLTPQKLLASLGDGAQWSEWVRYFLNRELPASLGPNPLGSEDGYFFFRKDLPVRP